MFENNKINNKVDKKFILTVVFMLLCLALALVFPFQGDLQNITIKFFFLVIVPTLYIKFILKEKLTGYGLTIKDWKKKSFWGIIMLVFSLVITYLLINNTDLKKDYALLPYVIDNFWFFLFYELIFVNFFVFISEFFFRGFVLFTLTPKISLLAIPAQALLYISTLLISDSLDWPSAPLIILSITGGIVSYKNKSFIHSYIMGLLYIIILDAYIIYTLR